VLTAKEFFLIFCCFGRRILNLIEEGYEITLCLKRTYMKKMIQTRKKLQQGKIKIILIGTFGGE
jgi:hypothetical protein